MSEEPAATESQGGTAGFAAGLAAAEARGDPALREDLAAFLKDQRRMLHLQMEEMRHENPYKLSHFRLRRFSGWAKAALEASLGLIALALVGGLCFMVWNAAHSDGYVIESFAVPPDLAARGLTGEVAASRLLDRLNVVQTPAPNSVAAAQALSTSASEDVKVEIPETGISLGELYRFLRRWLGHEIHVSGEVVRQDNNLAVAIRVNGRDGATWQGPEADFDALIQKAAEHVFETVQPIRYASWLLAQTPRREADARAVYLRVTADPKATPLFRAGGWNGLSNMAAAAGDQRLGLSLRRQEQQADPNYALGFSNAVNDELALSHPEAALALVPQALAVLEKNHDGYSPDAVTSIRARLRTRDAALRGDYTSAIAELQPAVRSSFQPYSAILIIAADRALLHDGAAAAWLAEQPIPATARANQLTLFASSFQIETALQHWPRVIALVAEGEKMLAGPSFGKTGRELISSIDLRPWAALAKARMGDIAGAQSLIAIAPADCYDCVRIRGLIASETKQWARADWWFARAVHDAPSIPFAHEDWGRSLLARGKPDDAIAQFALANRKGPHFADALEGWGEALMAKSQSHLALRKFAEAEKYAPNWGRLHLKWGQALTYAGKKEDAAKHFARAATLDLTPSEKSELAKAPHG